MRDDVLISLLKQGLSGLDKQITKVVNDGTMGENIKMRSAINTTLFEIIDTLYGKDLIIDAESKKTFRRLKKEFRGEDVG